MNLFLNWVVGIVVLLGCNQVYAQVSISGTITDSETKTGISDVGIAVADFKLSTQTNKDGSFQLKGMQPANYLFTFTHLGYQTLVLTINLRKDTTIAIQLHFTATEMNEIVVTGVSKATKLKENPLIITTIGADELKSGASSNIIDALKNVPGVTQITTGPAISKPIIRGLGYNRVLTLYNGMRQEGQQWGDEHGIGIDQYTVDRVEIIKGPGSLMYGSDGIAGVINLLPPNALPIGKTKTQVLTNYQSNNNLMAYSLNHAGNKNGVQWDARFTNKWAGNYRNRYDGVVYNSGFREFDGQLFLGLNKKWGHTHLTLASFNQHLDIPEGDRDSLGRFVYSNATGTETVASKKDLNGYFIGIPNQWVNHIKVSSNNYFLVKKGSIKTDISFQNNKRREFGNPANINETELYFDLYTANLNTVYNLPTMKGWGTAVGISGMYQTNFNKGTDALIPEYTSYDVGSFVTTSRTFFNKLTFATGVRFDTRFLNSKSYIEPSSTSPKFTAFTRAFYGLSGSVGLSYQATKSSTIKLTISRGFRVPTVAELASNGRHEGTFRYEIGNQQLQPEYSNQLDVAYFLDAKHVTCSLTPFANFVNNYVYAQKLVAANGGDSIPNPSEPAFAYKYTQGQALLYGGEVYIDFHPHPLDWLHIANSFALVYATQLEKPDSLKYLPFIPAPNYRGEIKAQFQHVGKTLSSAYVQFSVNYVFQQNRFLSAYHTETVTPSYTLLNASIGADIKAFDRKDFLRVQISINNIANVAYQNHLSRLKYAPINMATGRMGMFNMGRNVGIKLAFTI